MHRPQRRESSLRARQCERLGRGGAFVVRVAAGVPAVLLQLAVMRAAMRLEMEGLGHLAQSVAGGLRRELRLLESDAAFSHVLKGFKYYTSCAALGLARNLTRVFDGHSLG